MNVNNSKNLDLNEKIKENFKQGKFENALHLAQNALEKAKQKGDQILIGHQYKILGNIYSRIGDFEKSHDKYLKALDVFQNLNNLKGISDILGSLGTNFQAKAHILKLQGKFNESHRQINDALNYQQKALNIRREILNNCKTQKNDKHIKIAKNNLALSFLNIAGLYRELNRFNESIKCQMKALEVFRESNDKYRECKSLLNIGNIFGSQKNYKCSLNFQFQALKIAIEKDFREELPKIYLNIGLTYQNLLDPKKALIYFLKSLNIFYLMLKEFNNIRLKNKFVETLNLIPFLINIIRKLRKGANKFKKFDVPLKKLTLEFYTSRNNTSPIRNVLINTTEEILVVSDAIELFEFKIRSVEMIINHLERSDFSKINNDLKDIIYQQIIVILVVAFEVYLKMRFTELNNKNLYVNLNELYNIFIPIYKRRKKIEEIKESSKNKGLFELEVFIDKGYISFQEWEDIIKAYSLGYNIDIKRYIPSKPFQLLIKDILSLRQKIIHMMFNFPKKTELVFFIKIKSLLKNFINNFHNNLTDVKYEIDFDYLNNKLKNIRFQNLESKEFFDLRIENIRNLVNYIESLVSSGNEDYRFKIIIYQQILVSLITAFEVYARNRFIEIHNELIKDANSAKLDDLYKKFISQKKLNEVMQMLREISKKTKKPILLILIENRYIDFKKWTHFKNAYKKAYGLRIGLIYNKSHILDEIQKCFKWRNKIIHSKIDSPVLNFENSPPERPIYLNKELINEKISQFTDFLNTFHNYTEKLIANINN